MSYKPIILFLVLLFFGCADKPSDDVINNGIATFLAETTDPQTEHIEGVHRMDEWRDENLKDTYYVEFACRQTSKIWVTHPSRFITKVDSIVYRLTFIRERGNWETSSSLFTIVSLTNLSLTHN